MKQLILQAADVIDQINTSPIPYPVEHFSAYITVCKKVGMYYLFCEPDVEKYINYFYMAIALAPAQPPPHLMLELLEPKVLFIYGVATAAAADLTTTLSLYPRQYDFYLELNNEMATVIAQMQLLTNTISRSNASIAAKRKARLDYAFARLTQGKVKHLSNLRDKNLAPTCATQDMQEELKSFHAALEIVENYALSYPVAIFDLEKINRALAGFWSLLDSQTALTYFTRANTCMQKARNFTSQMHKITHTEHSQQLISSRKTPQFFTDADKAKPISGVAHYVSSPTITRA